MEKLHYGADLQKVSPLTNAAQQVTYEQNKRADDSLDSLLTEDCSYAVQLSSLSVCNCEWSNVLMQNKLI